MYERVAEIQERLTEITRRLNALALVSGGCDYPRVIEKMDELLHLLGKPLND